MEPDCHLPVRAEEDEVDAASSVGSEPHAGGPGGRGAGSPAHAGQTCSLQTQPRPARSAAATPAPAPPRRPSRRGLLPPPADARHAAGSGSRAPAPSSHWRQRGSRRGRRAHEGAAPRAYPPPPAPRCSRPASLRRRPKHCVQQQFPIACRPAPQLLRLPPVEAQAQAQAGQRHRRRASREAPGTHGALAGAGGVRGGARNKGRAAREASSRRRAGRE